MLILHVHDRWSALGGADWHLLSILDSLPPGFRAAGLFGRADGSVRDEGAGPGSGVKAPFLAEGIHFIKNLDKKAPFSSENQVGGELASTIGRIKPDLIHVHNILNPHLLDILTQAGPGLITVQDHRFFCPGRGKVKPDESLCHEPPGMGCAGCFQDEDRFIMMMQLVKARLAALAKFDQIIVLSSYMKEELVEAGLDRDRIRVIPPFAHGLDQTYSPAAFGREVLFVGRVVWAKGIFDIFEAMALADKRFRLVVAGAGTVDEQAAARVRELGLESRVDFMGWADHHEMTNLYRKARMVVMPSRWREPFGIAGLEAMAMSRPVTAYEVGGIPEWLEDGVTGILIPPANYMALAAAVNVIMRDPGLATELGRAGFEAAAQKFNPRESMRKLLEVYEKA